MSCCVLARGDVFIREQQGACDLGIMGLACEYEFPWRPLGNLSTCMVQVDSEVLGKENEFLLSEASSRLAMRSVELTLSIACASDKNLTLALLGEDVNLGSGAFVQTHPFCALSDETFFRFERREVDKGSVSVQLYQNFTLLRTLVLDQDYVLSDSGVQIIQTITDPDATKVLITYNYDSSTLHHIEFFQAKPKYKEIFFKGTNYADAQGKPFDATFYKVLFNLNDQLDFIMRDDFLILNLVGSVEKHNGKWFNIQKGI